MDGPKTVATPQKDFIICHKSLTLNLHQGNKVCNLHLCFPIWISSQEGELRNGCLNLGVLRSMSSWNSKARSFERCQIVVNAWNGNRVELLIKGLSFISEEDPSFRV